MSFLAGRLAATEGAYFSQTTKETIAKLREKAATSSSPKVVESSSGSASLPPHNAANADVLPEILQHSLPEQQQYDGLLPSPFSPSPSSLAASFTRPANPRSSLSYIRGDTTGIAFLPSLPQASFGPRRWKPADEEVRVWASTANEARIEGMPTIDDEKAKALVDGYSSVMKAFLIATALVVGGATVAGGVVVSKLQIHSIDDIRIKGHEYMQPRVEAVRESFDPWKRWVQERSRDWSIGNNQQNAVGAPFAKVLGLKELVEDEGKKG
eukprot:c11613_g1_i1 orf=44-847(+)